MLLASDYLDISRFPNLMHSGDALLSKCILEACRSLLTLTSRPYRVNYSRGTRVPRSRVFAVKLRSTPFDETSTANQSCVHIRHCLLLFYSLRHVSKWATSMRPYREFIRASVKHSGSRTRNSTSLVPVELSSDMGFANMLELVRLRFLSVAAEHASSKPEIRLQSASCGSQNVIACIHVRETLA